MIINRCNKKLGKFTIQNLREYTVESLSRFMDWHEKDLEEEISQHTNLNQGVLMKESEEKEEG